MIGAAELALLPRGRDRHQHGARRADRRGGAARRRSRAATSPAPGSTCSRTSRRTPAHALRRHPAVIATPHVAGVTDGSLVNMGVMAAECIVAVLTGRAGAAGASRPRMIGERLFAAAARRATGLARRSRARSAWARCRRRRCRRSTSCRCCCWRCPGLLALIDGTRGLRRRVPARLLLRPRAPHLRPVLDHRGDPARVGALLVAGAAGGAGAVGAAGAVHRGAVRGGASGRRRAGAGSRCWRALGCCSIWRGNSSAPGSRGTRGAACGRSRAWPATSCSSRWPGSARRG